jgi:hypothetical protein
LQASDSHHEPNGEAAMIAALVPHGIEYAVDQRLKSKKKAEVRRNIFPELLQCRQRGKLHESVALRSCPKRVLNI